MTSKTNSITIGDGLYATREIKPGHEITAKPTKNVVDGGIRKHNIGAASTFGRGADGSGVCALADAIENGHTVAIVNFREAATFGEHMRPQFR